MYQLVTESSFFQFFKVLIFLVVLA